VDLVQKSRSLLHFIDHHQSPAIPVAFSEQCRTEDVFREDVGFQQIDDLGATQVVGNSVGLADLPRPPQEGGFSRWEIKRK
jgi:hypothetical protein